MTAKMQLTKLYHGLYQKPKKLNIVAFNVKSSTKMVVLVLGEI